MTLSVLLRIARDALANGRLAGQVELVESGERTVVRDSEELIAFLRAAPVEPPPSGQPSDRPWRGHDHIRGSDPDERT
jgi:hypothetical protein